MSMGQRIRQARMDAGLSQRQLAGDVMTRNMLSALEHDGANPSVATLKYLSEKLCKPIGYFLEEDAPELPEIRQMELARSYFQSGRYSECLKELESLQEIIFYPERKLLEAMCLLELTENALERNKLPYCRTILKRCEGVIEETVYMHKELKEKWQILAALTATEKERGMLAARIQGDDTALLLRAEGALAIGMTEKAGKLLDAAEDQNGSRWNLLRGDVYFKKQDYSQAIKCYQRCEEAYPIRTKEKLEICYREMGDYKMAYYYAKKDR